MFPTKDLESEVLKLEVRAERITWYFALNGMEALLRRPPTLITPPRKMGCSGSSELLWSGALLA